MTELLLDKKRSEMVAIFRWQCALLESLMPRGWFEQRRPSHRAYTRWSICRAITQSGGLIPANATQALHREIVSTVLDTYLLAQLSGGDSSTMDVGSFEAYGDRQFTEFRRSRVFDPNQFDDLLVELTYGAWELMKGSEVSPLARTGEADMVICRPRTRLQFVAECKRLTVANENRLRAIVRHANRQIRSTSPLLPGLLVVDLTSAMKGQSRSTNPSPDDVFDTVFRSCLRGEKNRSISVILLIWDQYEHETSETHGVETLLQRRAQVLLHPTPRHAWPAGEALFDGITTYASLDPLADTAAPSAAGA